MAFLKTINSYSISYATYNTFNEWKANIILRNSSVVIVDLRFVDNPASQVSNQMIRQNGISLIYTHIDQFPVILDILRNEKPLCVQLNDDTSGSHSRLLLITAPEPTGETELTS
jgi:hypothetical protein